ncbi:MAG TPA: DUF2935 domain-containing protein [Clostridiales bacterium]|nr:DUF2935 domain-containing protein [Clostridiales bacterium]
MLSREEFIIISLEINLFFQRIMKEHLFFIETSLQPVEADKIAEANALKRSFEHLLSETVSYANGVISEGAIRSNEFVTPFTLRAEEIASMLTGAGIDTNITRAEMELTGISRYGRELNLEDAVADLNARSLNLLEDVIAFQKKLIDIVLRCKILIPLYPLLLEHITREAEYYQETLESLQKRRLPKKSLCDELNFWNNIMGEHAEFIDGLLDPTEKNLKKTANQLANVFERLVKECAKATDRQIIMNSLDATESVQNYKRTATIGLLECKIRSIISPLLGDHVLREANHYLRILNLMRR